ncbi:Dual specificity protein phosphatase 12 [Hondaea fermentalgiana]|uniref:Dual specificity protein phosphatase 12 n=1 Tax=Hondaea fermentalgiana TaxID=2315210 RepID=A0A2R5GDK4_9STRA|nr:Dual specificity protein phosphatase 12 [Hondaea fermentalgiana]|eukprot:GBG29032.1 Dual specificity protein phosphatase 12 [Hondaea fermentalgiana]
MVNEAVPAADGVGLVCKKIMLSRLELLALEDGAFGVFARFPQRLFGTSAGGRLLSEKAPSTEAMETESPAPEAAEQAEEARVTVYCCQRCRCALFTSRQLSSQHATGQHDFGYFKRVKDSGTLGKDCSSLFLSEPNEWMSALAMADEVVGKLNCPKCGHRVGSFAWAGSQCSCGTWIVPAIQVPLSKVDPREISLDAIPAHCADLKVPETVDEGSGDKKESGEDEDETNLAAQSLQDAAAKASAEARDPRELAHEKWINLVNKGAVDEAMGLVDRTECSMTTVQKKIFDGPVKLGKVVSASTAKLKGRITIEAPGAVAMPAPSQATRIIFSVDGIEGRFGEAISWAPETSADGPKVQHVMRVKDPSDAYLHGQR